MKYKVMMPRTEVYSKVIEVYADGDGAALMAAYSADFYHPDEWEDVETFAKIIKRERTVK